MDSTAGSGYSSRIRISEKQEPCTARPRSAAIQSIRCWWRSRSPPTPEPSSGSPSTPTNGHQFWLNPRDRPQHRGRRECGARRPSGVRRPHVRRPATVAGQGGGPRAWGTERHGPRAVHRRGGHLRGQLERTTRRRDPRAHPAGRGRGGHRRRRGARLDARPDLPRRGPPTRSTKNKTRTASSKRRPLTSVRHRKRAERSDHRRPASRPARASPRPRSARRQERSALRVRLSGFRRAPPAIVGARLRSRRPVPVQPGRWSRRAALAVVTRRGRRS